MAGSSKPLGLCDDTIIFASGHPPYLSYIKAVLGIYDQVSGQLINKSKSSYYMHVNVAHVRFQTIGDTIGFTRGEFSFTYLG